MKKIILVILFVTMSFAQTNFELTGQLRTRFELDNKDFSKEIDAKNFTLMRSRLAAKFTKDSNIEAFIQLQDSRVWGIEGRVNQDLKNVDLHQAYLLVKDFFNAPIDLQLGRMEVAYGNQRLISNTDWNNVASSYDGVKIKIKGAKVNFDLFAFQINKDLALTSKDKFLSGIYTNINVSDKYKIDPFIIWDRDLATSLSRITPGLFINGKFGNFSHETELIYQTGKENGKDIKAYLLAFNLSYTLPGESKTTFSAGIDYLSGDDDNADNTNKIFNTLYASGHKFYGGFDAFTNIPTHTKNLGLNDIHVKTSFNLNKDLNLALAFHLFNSAVETSLSNGSKSKSFGNEFDLVLNYKYSKDFTIQTGFAIFNPGDIFKDPFLYNRKDMGSWGYLQAVLNL